MVINMKRVQRLSSSDFSREVYLSPIPVVVDVYADWCGPCRAIAPLLERLAEHYEGRIRFVKVNIDENPEVAQAFQVEGVPTLLFFRDGQLTDRVVGLADPRQLVAQLERHASGSAARL
jgi:thioredoxin 1